MIKSRTLGLFKNIMKVVRLKNTSKPISSTLQGKRLTAQEYLFIWLCLKCFLNVFKFWCGRGEKGEKSHYQMRRFAQFGTIYTILKTWKILIRGVLLSWSCLLKPAILHNVTFLNGCFSRFLNCINGIKLYNTSQISAG